MSIKFLLYLVLTILALCQKAFCQQNEDRLIHETIKTETIKFECGPLTLEY